MKTAIQKRLLTTASALTLMACTFSQAQAGGMETMKPAMADPLPGITSVMSLWIGRGILDSQDSDYDGYGYFTFGGDARVSGKNYIAELVASSVGDTSTGGDDEGSNYIAGAGHWLRRGQDRTLGLFGGLASTGFQDSDNTALHLFGGVEGAIFRGQWTYFGQGGLVTAIDGDETDTWEDGGFVRGGVRFFHTPQSRIEADVMVGFGDFDKDSGSSDDGIYFAWGAEYERQLGAGSPFSFFSSYRGHYVEEDTAPGGDSDTDVTDHVFTFGFRIAAGDGGQSLRQRDQFGATTFNLPDFHRAFAFPDEL